MEVGLKEVRRPTRVLTAIRFALTADEGRRLRQKRQGLAFPVGCQWIMSTYSFHVSRTGVVKEDVSFANRLPSFLLLLILR